jgi:TrmH family RNA methyltransferase
MSPQSQSRARRLHALRSRKEREASGLFLAEGLRVVEELLASGIVTEEVIAAPSLEDTERGRALLQGLPAGLPVYRTSEAGLRQLADTDTPQGIVAVGRIPRSVLPETLLPGELVVALDGVQDPGNFGTLARSADAFGVRALVGLPGTVDFWNGKAVRAAAGAAFRLPLVGATVPEFAAWSAAAGVEVWGTAVGGEDVASVPRPERLALLLGNEGAGLGQAAARLAGRRVGIPIRGTAESLNVAMAGTIFMYLLTKANA